MKKRKLSLDESDHEPEEEDEEAKEMTISSAVGSTCGLIPCLARLIEEYDHVNAGDWCLVEQPVPYKRYKLGVIKKIVMDRKRRVWVWIFLAIVNVYTHTARVPFRWLYPAMIDVENNQIRIDNIQNRNIQKRFLRIVASGSRDKMEEMCRSIE